ncbi:MAG: M20/M25/M40 family metallo-hydrolase [Ignavibacteria bacterium]|jgi:hypothetical protein|nr:M20/M25/M40 family metallo-hydrolase [Ignavibacteria bacterium]
MKSKILIPAIILVLFIMSSEKLFPQAGYSPRIDSVINLCTNPVLSKLIREFSGDTATMIGGVSYTLLSRHSSSVHNPKAAQFIYERFLSYGLQPKYMNYSANGTNVYVKKTGTKYPNRQYIICAHYDDMPSGPLAPGADDNASGSCAVMEAARLLANRNFEYTLIFVLFDEEEQGLIGSKNFADSAYFRGDSIIGVINLDMISWDGNNDYQINIRSNTPSLPMAYTAINVFYIYQPVLVPFIVMNVTSSDHASFWTRGYKAICGIQQRSEFNQYYHTINDKFQIISMPYYLSYTRSAIAALMTYGWDYLADIIHSPVTVSQSNVPVNTHAVIRSPHKIAKNINGPRLYYKVNNGPLNYVIYNYNNLDTFKFTIPGQSAGSTVKYYIAAQDSLGNFVVTKPSRGRGINPPGTTEPDSMINYTVITGIASVNETLVYSLEQNYPNPFNPATSINYQLAANSYVSLKIFDVTGREVAVLVNAKQAAGFYKVEWDASKFSSGVYFYKLVTDNYINTKKMMLIK